ncbi:hypothetical protein Acr_00g0038970 [Actinidia rufa]|uniref:CCHC-type domain-containing protein n=1 Tax=Actinidia rufa TaxID=165716 RepID=A0A7J0DHN2_9ERIC|nr:hypothetical protein Acr_00g0038970 [Actinidia rufa]
MAHQVPPRKMKDEESSILARGVEQEEQEPRAQNQSDATDRLATLMAQYMEYQIVRMARSTTLHEQFIKLNLLEFVGATNLLMAEEWLKKLGAIFKVMEVLEEHELSLTTFMLKGEAWNWWKTMRRMTNAQLGGVPITWQRVEGHIIRDCPISWANKCYQYGQPGHITRNCTQGPTTTSSVGSAIGGSKGATESARQGQVTTSELRTQARVLCYDAKRYPSHS